MHCVLLSSSVDLRAYFGDALNTLSPNVTFVMPDDQFAPEKIELALAWRPPQGQFPRFPNLKVVCSIAAGVDNILACPDLPPHVTVARVIDRQQGALMSAFALWHVLWHLRRFDKYLDNQRRGVWAQNVQ